MVIRYKEACDAIDAEKRVMNPRVIKSEADYEGALGRIDEILEAKDSDFRIKANSDDSAPSNQAPNSRRSFLGRQGSGW